MILFRFGVFQLGLMLIFLFFLFSRSNDAYLVILPYMLITAAVSKDGKSAWNSDIGSIDGSNGPYDKIQETFWREGKFVLWSLSRYLIS